MKCLIIDGKIDRNWPKYKCMGWEHIQRRGAEGIGLCHHSYAPHPRDKTNSTPLARISRHILANTNSVDRSLKKQGISTARKKYPAFSTYYDVILYSIHSGSSTRQAKTKPAIPYGTTGFSGAARQIRTADLILTKDALYRLSYISASRSTRDLLYIIGHELSSGF